MSPPRAAVSDTRGSMARTMITGAIDVRATLRPLGTFGMDPCHRWTSNSFAKAVLTPRGPGTIRLTWNGSGSVDALAWGSGAAWLVDRAPHWVGLHDDLDGFDPSAHPRVAGWWRNHAGVRLPAAGVIWQELVLVLLGQRVTVEEAIKSWARMTYQWGEPAPGPCDLRLPPAPDSLAERSYVDFHRLNVDRRRAEAILLAARRAHRLEEAATMTPADAFRRLTALPGLGAWTATSTIGASHGDPDTIVLRDYGLPTLVNYVFTGSAERLDADKGGDERMCEHLAPWAGHRQRIVRLIRSAGVSVPRRHPRSFNPDIRRL
jgi:3-methyladenine DNA glycosylase/8-oxoguanine DNA glycosylase